MTAESDRSAAFDTALRGFADAVLGRLSATASTAFWDATEAELVLQSAIEIPAVEVKVTIAPGGAVRSASNDGAEFSAAMIMVECAIGMILEADPTSDRSSVISALRAQFDAALPPT